MSCVDRKSHWDHAGGNNELVSEINLFLPMTGK